ncbi:MAG: hypothetical protein H7228_14120 [Polaromonas sp.]|nr:hypothetical protein [Polaromonas sp.]
MYLRAGVLSLGLLIASRVLGLLRESAQAAAFGSTGLGDAVIVMFTLPDLLVGILFSGALSYVLLPLWAQQNRADQQASQKKVARLLLISGMVLGTIVFVFRDLVGHALAPGLVGDMKTLGANSLLWSAAVLPLAMLAALWVTRLQHERDFIGMYAGNLLVNVLLVAALFFVRADSATFGGGDGTAAVLLLGDFLLLAMLARLGWLYWRLPKARSGAASDAAAGVPTAGSADLPKASVWLWAALSSGLLLLLPLIGRSLASQSGEGALASFNYAWKLVELPLVLAIQLVASLAFPAITRTEEGSHERKQALQMAFTLAWALACAAIAVVATFSLPLAGLLFGWGRMSAGNLEVIAQWSAAGIWSLLPQALIAVLLTVMATSRQMHVAVWAYVGGVLALAVAGALGLVNGVAVMWALNAVLAGVALSLLFSQRRSLDGALPWAAMLVPLMACVLLVLLKPWLTHFSLPVALPLALPLAAVFALTVLGTAFLSSPILRSKFGLKRRLA